MTGLLGGGHAIYWDAATGRRAEPRLLLRRAERQRRRARSSSQVPFGEELVHYAVGAGLVRRAGRARPGSTRSGASTGGCRGRDLCEPALRLARDGVPMPPAHVACLEMLEPVMTMREGARIYAPGGPAARPGELLEQPGLVACARARSPRRARRASTPARSRESLLALMRRARRRRHARRPRARTRRAGASRSRSPTPARASSPAAGSRGVAAALAAPAARCAASSEPSATLALLDALDGAPAPETHTTNLVAVDARGQRLRPDDEPRPRLRRLAPGPRPAPEQHARRGRPARRRRSSRASGCRA